MSMKIYVKSEFVREMLARTNRSQFWLASQLGISTQHLSQILAGTRCPSWTLRDSMLKVLKPRDWDKLFKFGE